MNKFLIFPILLLMALSIGFVSANDNGTIDVSLSDGVISQDSDNNLMIEDIDSSTNESSKVIDEISSRENTKIEAKDIKTYYKEDVELVSYLKDSNNKPLSNKKVSIFINNIIENVKHHYSQGRTLRYIVLFARANVYITNGQNS